MTVGILTTLLVNSVIFTALFGLMILVRKLLAKKVSAVLQYALWAVVIVKLVIPFGFESSLSPFGLLVSADNKPSGVTIVNGETSNEMPGLKTDNFSYKDAAKPDIASVSDTTNKDKSTAAQTDSYKGAEVKTAATAKPLDWMAYTLYIWALGVIASGTLMVFKAQKLRRGMYSDKKVLSGRVMSIFNDCKRDLRLRRNTNVIVQPAVNIPLAMGVLHPVIVLPDDIDKQTDKQIRHVCMHELAHVKYGDLTVICIMNALCAAYWFNPLVWLCFRLVRKDMESACDARVLKKLGNGARQEYIGTVLNFASRKKEWQLYSGGTKRIQAFYGDNAAMGMADGRFTMEQRVRGMFMKTRTGAGSRVTAAVIAVLMLASCMLTACQPTPSKPIVQSKNNNAVLNEIKNNAPDNSQSVIHKFSAPQSWQGDTDDKDKKIDIKVDAKVDVPTDTWGIYQLKTLSPDKAYFDKVLKALIGDAKLYGEDTYASKAEIQKRISEYSRTIAESKNQIPDQKQDLQPAPTASPGPVQSNPGPNSGPSTAPGGYIQMVDTSYYENLLAQAQQALSTAPDKPVVKRVEIDPNILFEDPASIPASSSNQEAFEFEQQSVDASPKTGLIEISGFADIGRTAPARILLSRPKGGRIEIRFQIGCGGNGGFGSRKPLNGKAPEGVTVSQSDAEKTARQKVAEMGFGYLDIAAVDKKDVYNSTLRKDSYCYAFTFTRSLDGVPATYAYGDGADRGGQYAPSWNVSEVLLGVDDSGVIYADINVPKSDVQQLAKSVELKDFSDIMDIFNKQAVIQGCYCQIGNAEEMKHLTGKTVNIDDIKLGYMPTVLKEHPDQIIFVPVWDFFGSEVMQFTGTVGGDFGESLDKNDQFHYDYGEQSFLTINAIDGTIMQRTGGPG